MEHSTAVAVKKDVELALMQMPSKILGAMYHASISLFVLPAVVAHAPSQLSRVSCRLYTLLKKTGKKTKKRSLTEVSHVC